MKLILYIEYYNPGPDTQVIDLWYQSMIWAITEHGLSLFAASILAIRPFFSLVYKSYGSISSKLGYGSGSGKSASTTGAFSRSMSKGSNVPGSPRLTEMDTAIGLRHDYDDEDNDYDLEHGLGQPDGKVETYGVGENSRRLARGGSKAQAEVEADEVARWKELTNEGACG